LLPWEGADIVERFLGGMQESDVRGENGTTIHAHLPPPLSRRSRSQPLASARSTHRNGRRADGPMTLPFVDATIERISAIVRRSSGSIE
jgi:hypothetical protein